MCYVNPNEATEKECGAIYVINSSPSGILQITTETVDGETIITATFLNWIDEENDLPFTYRLECTNKDGSVIKFE